jgi:CheY-like chemotaxis protein
MEQKKSLILIVDDNEVILKTISLKLKANNYDAVTAIDGSQALAAVRERKPDLILLDISFPPDVASGGGVPWDGFRMLEWFHRIDEAKDTPIIIITAGDAVKYKAHAIASGAAAFFQKPINTDELVEVIQQTLAGPKKATVAQTSAGGGALKMAS